jgi:2'-5' RNA ligase
MSADAPRRRRRLFIGVELTDAAQDAIDAAAGMWRDAIAPARWTPRPNRHVTLRFLGGLAPELVDGVHEAVASVATATPAFPIALGSPGRFPANGRARVLWVGLVDGDLLGTIVAGLATRLPAGTAPDTRPYTAHVTVARADPPIRVPDGWTETPVDPSPWQVRHLTLFESHLGRPHARYEVLERCPLAHVADPGSDPR